MVWLVRGLVVCVFALGSVWEGLIAKRAYESWLRESGQ